MTLPEQRRRTIRVEVGAAPRDYVNAGRHVTLVPLTIKRRSTRKLLIPPAQPLDALGVPASASAGTDEPMVKALGKAFHWKRLLDDGTYATTKELGRAIKTDPGWIDETVRMTLLAPDIVAAILAGRQPRPLNLHTLHGRLGLLSRDWDEQRRFLGFSDT